MPDSSSDTFNLKEKQIHVWLTFSEDIKSSQLLSHYKNLLSFEEKAKYERFSLERHRREYLISRGVIRTVLSGYTNIPPEELEFTRDGYGRPELNIVSSCIPGIRFNLSHTNGFVLFAATWDKEIGVDVEYNARKVKLIQIASRYFSRSEMNELQNLPVDIRQYRFFDYWTLKESYLKALGKGLYTPLNQFSFSISENDPKQILFNTDVTEDDKNWQFWLFNPSENYTAAISVAREKYENNELIIRRIIPLQSVQSFDCNSITSGNTFI